MSRTSTPTLPLSARLTLFDADERRGFFVFGGLVAAYVMLALVMAAVFPDTSHSPLSTAQAYFDYALKNAKFFFIALVLAYPAWVTIKSGDMPITEYVRKSGVLSPYYIAKTTASLAIGFVGFFSFMFAYATIKTRIPELTTFGWDEAFMRMDRALFLGRDPWTVFAWIYDRPGLLRAIDTLYDVWAPIMVSAFIYAFLRKTGPADVRLRFPVALILTWFIGGNLLAVVFASAGPCYYGDVTGLPDVYAAQFMRLEAIHSIEALRALDYQRLLWAVYESPGLGLGGISAMPSMHCATSFLLILLARGNRVLLGISVLFFLIILCASFILGWHYAVDGVFAIPVALFGWWAARKLLTGRAAAGESR